jgi:uncharacterized protein YqeY
LFPAKKGNIKMLTEKIKQDLLAAIKNRDDFSVSLLRMLMAAFLNREKEKRLSLSKKSSQFSEKELAGKSALSNEEALEVIFSEVKKREDASSQFSLGKRQDLADKEKKEAEALKKYLPEQLKEEEIINLAKEAIRKSGAKDKKDIGRIMAELMPKVKGKATGETVSRIIGQLLSLN